MKNIYQSEDLLYKYKTGTCSDEERAIVESWHISELLNNDFIPDEEELNKAGKAIWAALPIHDDVEEQKVVPLWRKYAVAASVALILSVGGIYFLGQEKKQAIMAEPQAKRFKNDVNPGGNKAILTLADGSKISLDDVANGKVAQQSGIVISKTADGQLEYRVDNKVASSKAPQYNTVSTPRGGQYQLVLPDGTHVWLNAASKLKFPSSFAQLDSRKVELSGEAYFEVTKDKQRPFKVEAASQEVVVLGTHFNIDAYAGGSATKTTLLEGRVRLKSNAKDYLLKPGQQAIVGSIVRIDEVDTDDVVAWKNGNFIFSDNDIKTVMTALERWYDIEVVYEGSISSVGFNAEISRDRTLIQVLKALEKTGNVRFRIEGRRVIVM
ncbi:MAG: FecR domain-containing protein [Candidatus Pedobacter colombiensis]|uniref:FecR domain-containing protein n=1 Tax=Candidatus Pedobacter colombiensis TaxID=3121371 RepID=A0AAJ5W6L7_9SPHI|nr:FecR family protein [Pedobacter sp.]WEK18982.1 MAG: FecR domain-containing protein [Pedobacter sp.]